jgi:hypothetical protein
MIAEDFTFPAHLHLVIPAVLRLSVADRPVDKPAEMACLEFPGRTGLASLRGTAPDLPAGADLFRPLCFGCKQEKDMSLDVHGDLAPSLLEALNRFNGGPQKFGKLLLGLLKSLTMGTEFTVFHFIVLSRIRRNLQEHDLVLTLSTALNPAFQGGP